MWFLSIDKGLPAKTSEISLGLAMSAMSQTQKSGRATAKFALPSRTDFIK
jgi:hypothetical protein